MEMVARVALVQPHEAGATTVPARKFFDIRRGLPEGVETGWFSKGDACWCVPPQPLLSTLPADFPNLDDWQRK